MAQEFRKLGWLVFFYEVLIYPDCLGRYGGG